MSTDSIPAQERDARIAKIKQMRDLGVEPYPSKYEKEITHSLSAAKALSEDTAVVVTGRVMLMREMGGLIFAKLQDESGSMQIVLEKKSLQESVYAPTDIHYFSFFKRFCDMADFVGVSGKIFTTKKGEISVFVESWQMLAKAILPLPEKWHGLQDQEERFRKRYLDILLNEDVREMFVKKARFWQSMRQFLINENFLEVETPVLETTTGGADAEPFATHHNALDMDVYLRISCGELWQKELMVAGYNKVFEIGRIFRNEGMSPEHLQDYTQMEFYWGYADYNDSRALVEKLYKHVAKETFGTLQFTIKGFEVDLDKPWETYDFREQVLEKTGIDIQTASLEEMKAKLDELGVKYDKSLNPGRAMDYLWKHCRKQLAGPGFLLNHPVAVSPLAKRKAENPDFVERYQVIIAGSEVGNGYSEINDPLDQAERFAQQAKAREAGDKEAQMFAHEFVEALEHGMPPTSGFGVSERLFTFLMDKPIREAVIFPLMKPKDQE